MKKLPLEIDALANVSINLPESYIIFLQQGNEGFQKAKFLCIYNKIHFNDYSPGNPMV